MPSSEKISLAGIYRRVLFFMKKLYNQKVFKVGNKLKLKNL